MQIRIYFFTVLRILSKIQTSLQQRWVIKERRVIRGHCNKKLIDAHLRMKNPVCGY